MQTYGLSVEAYAWLLYKQDFRCPICEQPFSHQVISAKTQSRATRPCVDHNHATGQVRGLVCGWCNYKILGPLDRVGYKAGVNALAYLTRKLPESELN